MAKKYTESELKNCSKDILITLFLHYQDQMSEQLDQLNSKLDRMAEQLAVLQNNKFGRKSEKLDVIDGQLSFVFNEAEALVENAYVVEPAEEEVLETVTRKRKKKKGKREEDLSNLPVETVDHELSDKELAGTFGPDGWKVLPDEVYLRVKVEPAKYTVEEHHVHVYASKKGDRIVKATRPKSLLRNSVATPSLVASIMNAKYVNGLPLHRVAQEFQRNEVNISKQVMANWMIRCSERYLGPVFIRLHQLLLEYDVIQQDETPVKVSKDGRPANSKSFMWVYRTGKYYRERPIVLYDYQRTRKKENPERFLKGFRGICVSDAFSVYDSMDKSHPEITFAFCHVHGRRRFADALKALPKARKKEAKDTIAYQALQKIAAIYHLDNQYASLTSEERRYKRQLTIKPLVEDLFAWMKQVKEENILPEGSETLKGIDYYLNHEKQLKVFLDHGNVPLDNNATEASLRSFCLHKHTWKLIDTINGAESSALIYSIVETAKANNLNPFRYLEFLLTQMMDHEDETDYSFIDRLLPWSDDIPEICRIKKK